MWSFIAKLHVQLKKKFFFFSFSLPNLLNLYCLFIHFLASQWMAFSFNFQFLKWKFLVRNRIRFEDFFMNCIQFTRARTECDGNSSSAFRPHFHPSSSISKKKDQKVSFLRFFFFTLNKSQCFPRRISLWVFDCFVCNQINYQRWK